LNLTAPPKEKASVICTLKKAKHERHPMSIDQIASIITALRRNLKNPPSSIEDYRGRFALMASTFPMIEGVERSETDLGGVPGTYFDAQHASKDKVLLYLHGGGYIIGSVDTYSTFMARLARATQRRVLGVEYRLAPEHPFPAGLEDCFQSYKWLLENGIAPTNISVGGDSAGGGMCIALLLRIRNAGLPLPACAFCISPWVDMLATGDSMDEKADVDPMIQKMGVLACAHIYLRGSDINEPLASPIYADLRGLPPLLIQVGTEETLFDDAKRLAEKAEECGIEVELEIWEEMIHVWHLFAHVLDEAKDAIQKIGDFVRKKG